MTIADDKKPYARYLESVDRRQHWLKRRGYARLKWKLKMWSKIHKWGTK